MKWLKIILGVVLAGVLAVVGGLWIAGKRDGAGVNRYQVTIHKPAAEVMPWIVEPDKLKQWVGGFVSSKDLSNIGMKVGAQGETVLADPNQPGVTYIIKEELTAFEPNKLIELRMWVPDVFHGTVRYELTEANGATTVHAYAKFDYDRWLFRLIEPMITPSAQKKTEEDMNRLKQAVETQK